VTVPDAIATPDRDVAITPTAAGGMILAGVAHHGDRTALLVARFDATGRPDPSFAYGSGVVHHDLDGFEFVNAVIEAPGGGIVIVGSLVDFEERKQVATAVRLAPDGSLDPTFGDHGVILVDDDSSVFTSVVALPDGDIVAGGAADDGQILPSPLLARFPAR
jgi:hypothetical protein